MRGVKNYSKIFDLSSWKDRVALIEMGKPKNKCEVCDKELSFGSVQFEMLLGISIETPKSSWIYRPGVQRPTFSGHQHMG